MMFDSCVEKFRENDAPINANPIHAEEYAAQIVALDSTNRINAEEKLRLIAQRIRNHINAPENHAECAQCALEVLS